jgi:DNA-binding CsgD family transcriptional regulator/tetratricopeptide (TPR) repeat protein
VNAVAGGRGISAVGAASDVPDEILLERSAELSALADDLADVAASGSGRLVLIAGEAGIGKTALVRTFCAAAGSARVLSGACDALHTPRPLGPVDDIAEQTGGELAELVERCAGIGDLLAAFVRELRRRSPSVVVFEDLHWADQATLDLVRVLGRRIDTIPALIVATFRDDELDRAHPLRLVLGELPRMRRRRLSLEPLSVGAVADLAGPLAIAPVELHARTAGNPFYVTEALASGGASIPDGVRDAVLARAARLDPGARMLLDAVAIAPQRAELGLLEALAPQQIGHLETCLASGMLRAERGGVAFRHEIARETIEDALPPDRAVTLHRHAVRFLTELPDGRQDLARITHHAEATADRDAVLRYAPAAARRAAALGAHRQAADQLECALHYAGSLDGAERAELLERRSYECYLISAIDDAIDARRQALAEHSLRGDVRREGDSRRWLSRLLWFKGDNAGADAEGRRAVELLEPLPPGPELAMAYSNIAQLRMLTNDLDETRHWGARAGQLAGRLGETEILVHALNNVGTAEMAAGLPEGSEKLHRSLAIALEHRLEEHVARAYTNLGTCAITRRDYAAGDAHLESAIAYCRERDLDAWLLYMLGWRSSSLLAQGRWDEAARCATEVLRRDSLSAPMRVAPLSVLGRLRARRGDPDPWGPLDEAMELARTTGEVQRLAPVACARAEARWLCGEQERVGAETGDALALALKHDQAWEVGELLAWRRRAGIADRPPSTTPPEPFRLELEGELAAASEMWTRLGCPYDAAIVLAFGEDEAELRRGLAELQRLGARIPAAHVARLLRGRGVRDLRHGPRASTRENAAGLTPRELEVLALVAGGLRNGQIAERLVLSRKTVDHHVSSILGKLCVGTRTEAVAEARRLGIGM